MPSTYSQLLRVELQAVGENETTWGDITNTNLSTVLEQAIAGKADIVLSDANHTLTTNYGVADEARQAMLFVSGTTTTVRDIIVPRLTKHYIVRNNTSGGKEIQVKTSTGTGVKVANGRAKLVFCDGTNVLDASGGSVDAGVVSPSSLISEDASWVFEGFVGVNRSNAVDPNYGVFAADGPTGSYSAYYSNGTLIGQLTATSNKYTLSSAVAPVILSTAGQDRVVVSTDGTVDINSLLKANGALAVSSAMTVGSYATIDGALHTKSTMRVDGTTTLYNKITGTYADFSFEVEAGSFRVKGSGPTVYMQETDPASTRTLHMNSGNVGITSTINGWTFYSKNNGDAWMGGTLTQNSDERLKTNWADLPEDFVERMAGLKRGLYDRIDTGVRQVGVPAQGLEKILPEVVSTDDDGFKSVAYANTALVLGVELAELVTKQAKIIRDMEARLAALEAK